MKTISRILIISLVLVNTVLSQTQQTVRTVYEIPFASRNNIIELELVNNEGVKTQDLSIKIIDKPEWIRFKNSTAEIQTTESQISSLPAGQAGLTSNIYLFEFDILKEAPVGEETSLKFVVGNGNETFGEKEIKIAVAAPVNYELYQNYPNPFNPATTISYQLPKVSKINLKIYDILGSEVETLIDKEQSPGFHKFNWNAGRYSSGMYIYQLIAENNNGEKNIFRKKMLLIK